MTNLAKNKGFGLIEIVIGSAIILSGILAIIASYTAYVQYALSNEKNVEAENLLEEGLEAMSLLRDKGWAVNISALSTTTTYYLSWNGSYWATTASAQYVDGMFLRSINLGDVRRDGTDAIADSGTYDPNTRKITATVSFWQGHATTTQSISTYIANLYSN